MSTMLLGYLHTFFLLAMHVNSLCACSHSEAMKGSSSLRLLILSRLLASPVWAQLTLTDPTRGARSLYFQDGGPFHRVRAHSLTGVQNNQTPEERSKIIMDNKLCPFCLLHSSLEVCYSKTYRMKPICTEPQCKEQHMKWLHEVLK
jgi:hypothetical protein